MQPAPQPASRRGLQPTGPHPNDRMAQRTSERGDRRPSIAGRARSELLATGETARKREPSSLEQLTRE
jgi:hypothetical protein